MHDILFRCSALGKLMTSPTAAARQAGEVLSVGAKTYIRELVAQDLFGIDFEVSSKQMEKGIECEPEAIALLNRVLGTSMVKNTERRSDGFISGECDLFNAPRRAGFDTKVSWSAATFPIAMMDAENSTYLWQNRGYMRLYDADEWTTAYCLVNTPEHLIGYEPQAMHFFDHIADHMRVTLWTVKRDLDAEALMIEKVKAARLYYAQVVAEFDRTHPNDVRRTQMAMQAAGAQEADAAIKASILARSPALAAGLPAQATAPAALPENLFA